MTTRTIVSEMIGIIPVEKGAYNPGTSYAEGNKVTLYNCEFESKHDQNNTAPASLNTTTGVITFNTDHWKVLQDGRSQWLIDNGYKKVDASNVKDGDDTQHDINAGVASTLQAHETALGNRYTKSETYSKAEVNGLITTPDQGFVSVTATNSTTSVTDVLPATGEPDTIYRVGNWDGTQYDDTVYSEYAWDGTNYVHLSKKTQIGEVFDISSYHATGGALATYSDLEDALGTNGANVPEGARKGGMSIKFVQSSDNKYVQYRCKTQTFSVNPKDWQGEDLTVDGSLNTQEELSLVDENDNCIAQFKDGHIKTKEFDSRESATKGYVDTNIASSETSILNIVEDTTPQIDSDSSEELAFVDENDNCPLIIKDGNIKTKNFNSQDTVVKDNEDEETSSVSIVDENGNCVAQLKDGNIKTKNFNSTNIKMGGTKIEGFKEFTGTNWTKSTDGESVSCSTVNSFLEYPDEEITAWDFNISACFKPVGSSFEVGLGKRYLKDSLGKNSTIATLRFDGKNSTVRIGKFNPNDSNAFLPVSEYTLENISLVSGGTYWVRLVKTTTGRCKFKVVVTDEYGNIDTFSDIVCGTSEPLAGYGWGKPCVCLLSGTSVNVSEYTFGFSISDELKCIFLGHSHVEANSTEGEHNLSFCGLIQTDLGVGHCLNLGRGGAYADNVIEILGDYRTWFANAKYALVNIGANDLNPYVGTASFNDRVEALKPKLKRINDILVASGVIPVFMSVMWTYASGKPTIDSINPWMKANLMHFVDDNKCVEDGNGNIMQSAFYEDGEHPNVATNAKMYNCIKAQASFLFNY